MTRPKRGSHPSQKITNERANKPTQQPAKEVIKEPFKKPRKRRSSTLDRGEVIQVAETPSRLRFNSLKETPKQISLMLNGPRKEPIKLNFTALRGTQVTNDSMPPPPTPPATFSSLSGRRGSQARPDHTARTPMSPFH